MIVIDISPARERDGNGVRLIPKPRLDVPLFDNFDPTFIWVSSK
jgi:hypothetical protein